MRNNQAEVDDALVILFRNYRQIVNDPDLTEPMKCGYLAAAASADPEIPTLINLQIIERIFAIRDGLRARGITKGNP
jgi:hypothetical protein